MVQHTEVCVYQRCSQQALWQLVNQEHTERAGEVFRRRGGSRVMEENLREALLIQTHLFDTQWLLITDVKPQLHVECRNAQFHIFHSLTEVIIQQHISLPFNLLLSSLLVCSVNWLCRTSPVMKSAAFMCCNPLRKRLEPLKAGSWPPSLLHRRQKVTS